MGVMDKFLNYMKLNDKEIQPGQEQTAGAGG